MHARTSKPHGSPLRSRSPREPAFALFCVYALFVIYGTLLPFQFVKDRAALSARWGLVNWNPVHLVTGAPTPPSDLVVNVLFFVPLGIIGFHAQRRRRRWVAVLRCTAAGALLSAGVEALQFFTPSRNPATSDVLMNALGTFAGALGAAEFQRQLGDAMQRRAGRWMQRESLLPILVGCVALVLVMALVPLDLDLGSGWSARAVRRLQVDPWRVTGPWSVELQAMLSYAVLSGLAFRVASRLRRAPGLLTALSTVAAAGLLALGLEAAQILVRSRVAATRDLLAALAGSLAGVAAAVALGNGARGRHGWGLAALGFATCIIARAAEPFDFRIDAGLIDSRLTRTALVPYYSYYYKANVAAVTDFLGGMLLYLPFAFALAKLRGERLGEHPLRLGASVAGMCAGVALGLELLHLLMPAHYPEVSDVLTAALGGSLGAFAWRWVAHLKSVAIAAPPAVHVVPACACAGSPWRALRPAGRDAAPISPASS